MNLFCKEHDTKIFKPIEREMIDFDNYINQIIFTYRSVCADIRRKQIEEDFYKDVLKKDDLPEERRSIFYCLLIGSQLNIRDYSFYKEEIEKEMKRPQHCFKFYHYTYPPLGIYASTAFSYIVSEDYSKKVEDPNPWECCFLNIIPRQQQTEIIIGYHKQHTNSNLINLSHRLEGLDAKRLGLELTNMFLFHVEDWGMSPSLYDKIPPKSIQLFLFLYDYYRTRYESNSWIDFNLFEKVFTF